MGGLIADRALESKNPPLPAFKAFGGRLDGINSAA